MTTFGEFIKENRTKAGLGLRELARTIGIAPAYMSDIEAGKRNAPDIEKLQKLAEVLNLSQKQRNRMYDLAGETKQQVPPDIIEYIVDNKNAKELLRIARDTGIKDSDWNEMKEFVKNKNK